MQSPIQSSLVQHLEQAPNAALDIVVVFREWPSDSELASLGLRKDGTVARGRVFADKIRALASFPQVQSIAFDAEAKPQAMDPKRKIGGSLQAALYGKKADRYSVAVTFSTPPGKVDIAELTVEGLGGWGNLTEADIERLIQRSDTTFVDLLPKVKPR